MLEVLIIVIETLALAGIGMNRVARLWRVDSLPEAPECPVSSSMTEDGDECGDEPGIAVGGEYELFSLLPDDRCQASGPGVVARASGIAQPPGGLIPLGLFEVEQLDDGRPDLGPARFRGAAPALVGLAVDYLTRFMLLQGRYGYDANGCERAVTEAFEVSVLGGAILADFYGIDNPAEPYLVGIRGLDPLSIENACKLVTLDSVYRCGTEPSEPPESVLPDQDTIAAVGLMVNRTLRFLHDAGPVTEIGPTFEGAYTHLIGAGDGDYLTNDAIWDVKCLRGEVDEVATLQTVIYYLMARHSGKSCYDSLNSIGIYNPRRNISYLLKAETIPEEVIRMIERDVIGYPASILPGDKR